jgi:hypothetical protein
MIDESFLPIEIFPLLLLFKDTVTPVGNLLMMTLPGSFVIYATPLFSVKRIPGASFNVRLSISSTPLL